MKPETATIIGATGLIGGHLLEILKDDPAYDVIKVIVRRPVSLNHPKVKVNIIDFADEPSFRNAIADSDAVFCAVGTTNRKVNGDKTAYRKVDFDIPVDAARILRRDGMQPVFTRFFHRRRQQQWKFLFEIKRRGGRSH